MDENTYTAEAEAIDTDTAAAIDADWDETGSTESEGEGASEETGEKADQPEAGDETEEKEDEATDEEKPGEEHKEEDQLFELKCLGETRKVNLEEIKALAQKGMDYDRVRTRYDELKLGAEEAKRNNQFAAFVQDLAKASGITAEELIDQTRAKMLVSSEKAAGRTISEADALAQVKQERESKAPDQAALKDAKQREAVQRFMELYPGLESDKIPAEVWAEADRVGDLTGPYQKHMIEQKDKQIAELQREIEGLKQDKANEERRTGSRKGAGSQSASQAFDSLWYNGE